MNLATRREPTFHAARDDAPNGAHGSSHGSSHGGPHGGPHGGQHGGHHAGGLSSATGRATGLFRLVSTAQIVGSLLAVPLGLASGYSIYRANFSPDTTCQQLRGNIINMLDKSVDATTRRMLVRRDIEAFERSCGGVDPDAHAAFKRLLATDPQVAVPLPTPGPNPEAKLVKAEPKASVNPEAKIAKTVEAKVDVKPERKVEAKAVEAKAVETKAVEAKAVETKPVEAKAEAKPEPSPREAALTDARWLSAVRQALVKHPVAEEPEAPVLHRSWNVTPAAAPPVAASPVAAPPAAVAARAPELPQPQTVPSTIPQTTPLPLNQAPQPVADHPVPPAPIPSAEMRALAAAQDMERGQERSRLGKFIAELPLVGNVVRRGE